MTTNRYVVKQQSGWAVKAESSQRASAVAPTQAEAYAKAKQIVHNAGGGEVLVQGRDNKWQYANTIAPKPDKFPPRG